MFKHFVNVLTMIFKSLVAFFAMLAFAGMIALHSAPSFLGIAFISATAILVIKLLSVAAGMAVAVKESWALGESVARDEMKTTERKVSPKAAEILKAHYAEKNAAKAAKAA